MTDRHAAYIVILGDDIRDDSAAPIITALRMVKGVASGEPVVASHQLHIAQARVDQEWKDRIAEFARQARAVIR